jgi:precorrin-6A/cobalt-precorrin-6A reductase
MTIWIIGGTSDSVKAARSIASLSLPCTVTVTTPDAVSLYKTIPDISIVVDRFDQNSIQLFCQEKNIKLIIDASHPHAAIVSRLAIEYSRSVNIPYIRYERPRLETRMGIELHSVETLVNGNYLLGQRVLLTLGYKALPLFRDWHDRATLFTRLLPVVHSVERAIEAGFTSDRIIALRPPISAELERALWRQWGITLVITKASGSEGGEDTKRAVAESLGVTLITIARPKIAYPRSTSEITDILHFCRTYYV